MIAEVFSAISSIPQVIWSGVIGACLALFGVFLSNKSQTTRLQIQLKHDAEQKERDRLLSLRRDVYLQVPKESVKALQYLAALPATDLTKIADDEGINGYGSIAAQVSVLSNLETAEAVARLANLYAIELMEYLKDLDAVQDARADIKLGEKRFGELTEEVRRVQREKLRMLEVGETDERKSKVLSFWLEQYTTEQKALAEKLANLRADHQRELVKVQRAALERLPLLMRENIKVTREMRKEIGLSHDLDAFEAQMIAMADDLRKKSTVLIEGWADRLSLDARVGFEEVES